MYRITWIDEKGNAKSIDVSTPTAARNMVVTLKTQRARDVEAIYSRPGLFNELSIRFSDR